MPGIGYGKVKARQKTYSGNACQDRWHGDLCAGIRWNRWPSFPKMAIPRLWAGMGRGLELGRACLFPGAPKFQFPAWGSNSWNKDFSNYSIPGKPVPQDRACGAGGQGHTAHSGHTAH
eukprot:6014027-Prymnesium_polylepis.1